MMRKQWQRELQQLKLSSTQKQNIKQAMQRKTNNKFSPLFIMYPSFAALACLCLFLAMNPTRHSATTIAAPYTINWSKEVILFMIMIQLLLVINYVLALLALHNTVRWQSLYPIQKLRHYFSTWYGHVVGTMLLLCVMASLWIGYMLLPSITVIHGYFTITFVLTVMLLLHQTTRKRTRNHCPNCQTPFTAKEAFKMSWRIHHLQCTHCQQQIYADAKKSSANLYFTFPLLLTILQFSTIHYLFSLSAIIILSIYITKYIVPYSTTYVVNQNDDLPPPLW